MKAIDISGQRFGRLTAVERAPADGGKPKWRCRCDCGAERLVQRNNLTSGNSTSCGCARPPHPWLRDRTGERYGLLVAVERVGTSAAGRPIWKCKCDCGREVTVPASNLTSGNSTSCGCKRVTSGDRAARSTWYAMRQRCLNGRSQAWADYGGRGIRICDRWSSFANFLEDMGPRPPGMTIDRVDPDGHYEPSNCRWATFQEQAKTKRGAPRSKAGSP